MKIFTKEELTGYTYVELESMLDGFRKDEMFFAEEAAECPAMDFRNELQLAAEESHANYTVCIEAYAAKLSAEKAEITEKIFTIRAQIDAELDIDVVNYMTDVVDELCEYLAQLEAKTVPVAA